MINSVNNNNVIQNTSNDPVLAARLEYQELYDQFTRDSTQNPPDPAKIEQDIQKLLAFLQDPAKVADLTIFAKKEGGNAAVAKLVGMIHSVIMALQDYKPGSNPHQAWEFTKDLLMLTHYHV